MSFFNTKGKPVKIESVKRTLKRHHLPFTNENILQFYTQPPIQAPPQQPMVIVRPPQAPRPLFNPLTNKRLTDTRANRQKVALAELSSLAGVYEPPPPRDDLREPNVFSLSRQNRVKTIKKLNRLLKPFTRKGDVKFDLIPLNVANPQPIHREYKNPSSFISQVLFAYSDAEEEYPDVEFFREAKQLRDEVLLEKFKIVNIENFKPRGGCNKKKEAKIIRVKGYECELTLLNILSQNGECGYKAVIHTLNKYYPANKKWITNKKLSQSLNFQNISDYNCEQIELMYKHLVNTNPDYISIPKPLQVIYDITDYYDIKNIKDNQHTHETLVLRKGHYYIFSKYHDIIPEVINTKRTRQAFTTYDFETDTWDARISYEEGKVVINENPNPLAPTILHLAIETKHGPKLMDFYSDPEQTCARKLINYLKQSKQKHKFYAHNGGSFDIYFILNELTPEERPSDDEAIFKKGLSFPQVHLFGHSFYDTRCHMNGSLEQLCKDHKVSISKQTKVTLHGKVISTKQLCFYRPDLSYLEFLKLRKTDPEFWAAYNKYCQIDVMSLYEVWKNYRAAVGTMTTAMASYKNKEGKTCLHPRVKADIRCDNKMTIGSAARNMLIRINQHNVVDSQGKYVLVEGRPKLAPLPHYKSMTDFVHNDLELYNFVRSCIQGGISNFKEVKEYLQILIDLDIVSQYPAAMHNCVIPTGTPKIYTEEECKLIDFTKGTKHGCVTLEDITFTSTCPKFKPIASKTNNGLDWNADGIDKINIDTQMFSWLLFKGYLKTYRVTYGVLSDTCMVASKVTEKYINTIFALKQEQDVLKERDEKLSPEEIQAIKDAGEPVYNPSLRQVYKDYLNILYGKTIEATEKYDKFITEDEYDDAEVEAQDQIQIKLLGGKEVYTTKPEHLNPLITLGVFTLSYSKILLFEYLSCLPGGASSVIATETDGWLCDYTLYPEFCDTLKKWKFNHVVGNKTNPYIRQFKKIPIAFGENLGNLSIKAVTAPGESTYVLGKKMYSYAYYLGKRDDETGNWNLIDDKDDDDKLIPAGTKLKRVMKLKGIPMKTIGADGSDKKLLTEDVYKILLKEGTHDFDFYTLKKEVIEGFTITEHYMSRKITVKPVKNY